MQSPVFEVQSGKVASRRTGTAVCATPFVSVIMPIRNEADFIAESLGAVLLQDYPADLMEVFVVDGMSTDATREIVADLAAKYPRHSLKLLDNPGRIVATGLNVALRSAKGEVIVRSDGHCRIAPDYITRCVDHLSREQVDGVGGSINTIAATAVGRAIAAVMSSPFGVGGSAFRTVKDRTMLVDTVPFPAYTRAAIEMAGPFDEDLVRNQDDEYNYRLRKLGARILLASDVKSDYYSRTSLRSLWRQYFQYGFYKVRVMQKHVRQMQPRQFVPAAFVIALLAGALLAPFNATVRGLWLAVVVTYAAATVAASIVTVGKSGSSNVGLVAVAFPILHISYGLGFLTGLAHFARRPSRAAVQPGLKRDQENSR
ncbi:MAG: glycosyltransferase family 2 protein [Acidobacteriota bacterium]